MFDEEYESYNHHGDKNPINGKYFHIFIHKIVEKLNEGKDVNVVMCGEKGNGKSIGALRLAEIMHKELNVFKGSFDPERNLIYDTLDYLDIMRNIELPEWDEDIDINPKRECIIVDEAGVQLNKSDYTTEMNEAFGDMLDVQRKANCLVIYALPIAGDLDVRIKRDIDFVVEFIDVGLAKVTGYTYQHGRLDEDVRFFVNFNRQEALINPNLSISDQGYWEPDLPDDEEMIQAYTERENDYKQELPDKLYKQIKESRREDEEDGKSRFDEILEEKMQKED
jgi:hypothetical protein